MCVHKTKSFPNLISKNSVYTMSCIRHENSVYTMSCTRHENSVYTMSCIRHENGVYRRFHDHVNTG